MQNYSIVMTDERERMQTCSYMGQGWHQTTITVFLLYNLFERCILMSTRSKDHKTNSVLTRVGRRELHVVYDRLYCLIAPPFKQALSSSQGWHNLIIFLWRYLSTQTPPPLGSLSLLHPIIHPDPEAPSGFNAHIFSRVFIILYGSSWIFL